jgi:hypothetical protein
MCNCHDQMLSTPLPPMHAHTEQPTRLTNGALHEVALAGDFLPLLRRARGKRRARHVDGCWRHSSSSACDVWPASDGVHVVDSSTPRGVSLLKQCVDSKQRRTRDFVLPTSTTNQCCETTAPRRTARRPARNAPRTHATSRNFAFLNGLSNRRKTWNMPACCKPSNFHEPSSLWHDPAPPLG